MTTIAWDGSILASDKMCCEQDGLRFEFCKLFSTPSGCVLGVAGDLEQGMAVADWLQGGEKPEIAESFEGILIDDGRAYLLGYSLNPIPINAPHAIGSGRAYAIAAMHCGKNAIEAVNVAAHFEIHTGLGVDAYEATEYPAIEELEEPVAKSLFRRLIDRFMPEDDDEEPMRTIVMEPILIESADQKPTVSKPVYPACDEAIASDIEAFRKFKEPCRELQDRYSA